MAAVLIGPTTKTTTTTATTLPFTAADRMNFKDLVIPFLEFYDYKNSALEAVNSHKKSQPSYHTNQDTSHQPSRLHVVIPEQCQCCFRSVTFIIVKTVLLTEHAV
jgi:hypothetical protein